MVTVSNAEHDEQDSGLPPPGRRWGAGAQSVLPYLTRSLQAKPSAAEDHPREARPADGLVAAGKWSTPGP